MYSSQDLLSTKKKLWRPKYKHFALKGMTRDLSEMQVRDTGIIRHRHQAPKSVSPSSVSFISFLIS